MWSRLFPINRWLEPLFVIMIFGGIIRAVFYFWENAYLPQPFFYDPSDLWMDWFNTAFWAYQKGAYDSWNTLYPPLSFMFLRIFSLGSCYKEASPYALRACDWIGLATLHFFFFLNVFLLWRTFRKVDRSTAIWRALALGFGMPTLGALERGNVVVVCFTCLILGFGPLLKSARLRWFFAACAVNMKVYLLSALFPQLLRRRWLWFEGAVLTTIIVYLVTFAWMGDGTPAQLYENITGLSGGFTPVAFTDIWNAESYNPFIALLDVNYSFIAGLIGSQNTDLLLVLLPALQNGARLMIVLAAAAAWLRPEAVPMNRLTMFGMAFAMTASETGGYTECMIIFFVFMESWRGVARKITLLSAYLLLLPFDFIIDRIATVVLDSYLAGHSTFVTYYLTIGAFIRPLLVLLLSIPLACLTIQQVFSDFRRQGWSGRWRYRRDAAFFPGLYQPSPPRLLGKVDD